MWWVILAAFVLIGLGIWAMVLDDMEQDEFDDVPPAGMGGSA